MNRLQKVASALRGDRADRDEMDNDQAAADRGDDQGDTTSPAATSPDAVTDSHVVRDPAVASNSVAAPSREYPPTQPNAVVAAESPDSRGAPDAQVAGGRTAVDPNGAAGTGPGARQGDYWDDSDTVAASDVEAVAVTTADVPVADTDAANGYASNGSVPQQDQAGAAAIPDVPVTQTAEDAAVTETRGRTGRHAGVPAQDLRPGEAIDTLDDLGDLAYGNLLPEAADFTEQWQQIQFRFVDDPQASVTEAAEVVSQVTAKLEAAIQERQRAIQERQQAIQERQRSLHDRWGGGSEADTETLRETLRMYRAFLDQLIGSKA